MLWHFFPGKPYQGFSHVQFQGDFKAMLNRIVVINIIVGDNDIPDFIKEVFLYLNDL